MIRTPAAAVLLALTASPALAAHEAEIGSLYARAYQPEPQPETEPIEGALADDRARWRATPGAAILFGGDQSDVHAMGFVSFDTYLAEDFEFGIELGGWWINQDPDEAGALSAILNFRYHFLEVDHGGRDWSIYLDAGVGVMGATEEVPFEGSEFNFTPRAGVGASIRLGAGRLLTGVRWQHFSNARIFGADRNPSFDAVMIYAGFSIPF
ncbi:MAG: acyloxyacyl hydrolase [Planctomycetota bacterium]|nr:acyloxyacyl hydrolase [Planctomycetota bacterium]